MLRKFFLSLVSLMPSVLFACIDQGVAVQVLGSGGPELDDQRSSTSYLIWVEGKAKFLIDTGGGSAWRFEQAGAKFEDLDAIMYTHLHVDHVADLPVFVKGSFFTHRKRNINLYGPSGNAVLPNFDEFIDRLFNRQTGAYQYLGPFFDPTAKAAFLFLPQTIPFENKEVQIVYESDPLTISTISVMHGLLPALAWRLDIGDKSITISGDMNSRTKRLEKLAMDTDVLVAHTAINEQTKGAGQFLHMKPSQIGEIAKITKPTTLILSHFMNRSNHRENEIHAQIAEHFSGQIQFATDLSCWPVN